MSASEPPGSVFIYCYREPLPEHGNYPAGGNTAVYIGLGEFVCLHCGRKTKVAW